MPISLAVAVARAGPTVAASITTSSFSAPAGAVVIACGAAESASTADPITGVSGGSLSWTEVVRRSTETRAPGAVAAWWARVPADRSMSVTLEANASNRALTVASYVLRGVDADPIGAVTEGSAEGTSMTTTALDVTGVGSWAFAALGESRTGDRLPTHSGFDAAHPYQSPDISGVSGYRATTEPGPVTFSATQPDGSSLQDWNWVAVEVRAAPTGDVPAGRRRRMLPLLAR